MGRGNQQGAAIGGRRRAKRRRPAEIPAGAWRRKDAPGEEIEVIGACPDAGHLALIARDRLGALLIAPDVLLSRYEPAGEGGERISVSPPRRRRVPRSLLTTQDAGERRRIEKRLAERFGAAPGTSAEADPPTEKQLRYLGDLCARAGEPVPAGLSKREASRLINRLKKRLAAEEKQAKKA